MTAIARRIRLEVDLGDGVGTVALTLTNATAEQCRAVNSLLDAWLHGSTDTERTDPPKPPAPPVDQRPILHRCECGAEFTRPQALGAHRRYKHGAKVNTRPDLRPVTPPPIPLDDLPALGICDCGHASRAHDTDAFCLHTDCACAGYNEDTA